jgi:hypothetical protein
MGVKAAKPQHMILRWMPSEGGSDGEDASRPGRAGHPPVVETMPLERAAEADDRMTSGAAPFRMVLTTGL